MTDEEIRELKRAALSGDKDALDALEREWRREAKPDPQPAERTPDGQPMPSVPRPEPLQTLDPDKILGTLAGVAAAAVGLRLLGDRKASKEAIDGALSKIPSMSVPILPPRAARKRRKGRR